MLERVCRQRHHARCASSCEAASSALANYHNWNCKSALKRALGSERKERDCERIPIRPPERYKDMESSFVQVLLGAKPFWPYRLGIP